MLRPCQSWNVNSAEFRASPRFPRFLCFPMLMYILSADNRPNVNLEERSPTLCYDCL